MARSFHGGGSLGKVVKVRESSKNKYKIDPDVKPPEIAAVVEGIPLTAIQYFRLTAVAGDSAKWRAMIETLRREVQS